MQSEQAADPAEKPEQFLEAIAGAETPDLAERIERWSPAKPSTGAPRAPAYARAMVAGMADLPSWKVASELLCHLHPFAVWLERTGRSAEPADAFSDETLGAYVADELKDAPDGTRTAVVSRLKMLRSTTATLASVPHDAGTEADVSDAERTARAIEDALVSYVPTKMSPDRFGRVEALVRDGVRHAGPRSANEARNYVQWAAYLAGWVDAQTRPLRPDVVFNPATIDEFALELGKTALSKRTIQTMRSAHRNVARALFGEDALRVAARRFVGKKALSKPPYSGAEIAALIATARRLAQARARREVVALIALCAGAGPLAGEHSFVRVTDVKEGPNNGVDVALGRNEESWRLVRVLAPYDRILLDVAREAEAAGEEWLLGGEGSEDRVNHVLRRARDRKLAIQPDIQRLRSSYLVALSKQPHTIEGFLRASGSKSLDRVVELWRRYGSSEVPS